MNSLLEFLSLADPNVRFVVLGSVLLGMSSAVVGCFTFLRKRALLGDAIAHSILPGICLAFMVSGSKNPWILLAGAAVSGWLSVAAIDIITRKSKLKPDTAVGLVLSVFFGVGILLLTHIQHQGNASQAGLDKFLFGKAASMTSEDVLVFGGVGMLLLLVVIAFYKEFKLISFNPEFAKVIGLPVAFLEFLLATVTVLAVAVGIQAVGVVLMAALIISPAAAARFWTEKLAVMIVIAAIFGALSGVFGSFISFSAPSMPTGPWIVVALTVFVMISLLFAPQKGFVARWLRDGNNHEKILTENILKALYQIGEKARDFAGSRELAEIRERREFGPGELKRGLRILARRKLVVEAATGWRLTSLGLTESRRVVRLHRLWEMYLKEKIRLKEDHVHAGAEAIEHIITPEIERLLEEKLGFPERDPHNSEIPR
ncbi:MAG: metal ABC transporter permease [Bacteroidia bacterium]|nr:metal ABC transporter permease [Bacteroidia bacterium]